jgi:hypothetical protein
MMLLKIVFALAGIDTDEDYFVMNLTVTVSKSPTMPSLGTRSIVDSEDTSGVIIDDRIVLG